MPATLERKNARKLLRDATIQAAKKPLVAPGATSTTTPAGIAAHDPDAWANRQRAREFAREQEPATNGKHNRDDELPAEAWQESPSGSIVMLAIDRLHRHPDNRMPAEHDIVAMMESLLAVKQLEPVVVWEPNPVIHDQYQILSGETRWKAAKRLGWETLQARIVTGIDRAQALQLLARYNGERKDLDPIQKARLGQRLCTPVADGGAGLTREQAGQQLGLERASLSNLVKLLELPAKWQERVASGELPWSWAREMAAALVLAPVEAELDKAWKRKDKTRPTYETNAFDSRKSLVNAIEHAIRCDCRRLDEKHWVGSSMRAIDVDATQPAIREQLGIVEIEVADGRGRSVSVPIATNVKAYTEILEKQQERAEKKKAATAGRDDKPDGERKLSPAEERARDKEKAEQLTHRIAAWRHDWLKSLVARDLREKPGTLAHLRERLLVAIALDEIDLTWGQFDSLPQAVLAYAKGRGAVTHDPYKALLQLGADHPVLYDAGTALVCAAVLADDRDPRHPTIDHKMLDEIAATAGIDLADEWGVMQESYRAIAGEREDTRFARFFALFQTDQLDGLGKELGVHVADHSGKAAKMKLLLSRDRNLKLPKAIKPLAGERRPSKPKVTGSSPVGDTSLATGRHTATGGNWQYFWRNDALSLAHVAVWGECPQPREPPALPPPWLTTPARAMWIRPWRPWPASTA